jgi:hypothetical protein
LQTENFALSAPNPISSKYPKLLGLFTANKRKFSVS